MIAWSGPVGRRRSVVVAVAGLLMMALAALAAGAAASLGVIGSTTPPDASGPPRYIEETASAGIEHVYQGDDFFVGGGVAVFDCSGDSVPDVYLAGGSEPAALYRNAGPHGGPLAFSQVPASGTDVTDVTGAYPIDIDGDRLIDLAVLRLGENLLLRGLGDCRFERANDVWSFDGREAWTTAFSAKWERGASLPTLAIGNYVQPGPTGSTAGGTCADNELIAPKTGTASDRFGPPTVLSPGWCTLSILFSDWDRSGRRDLRMTNDRHYYSDGQEQLWRVTAGEDPRAYTADDGWVRMQIWGMGIASHDLTRDGYPEVYLTSQADNKLQTLAAGTTQPRYRDIALRLGANVPRPFTGGDVLPSTAWHPEFADVNSDGLIDLFVSKGNVNVMSDFAQLDPSNLLLGQTDGTFHEAADQAGILSFDRGRGAALADLNMDGLLDLIEVNYAAPVRLWRNVGEGDAASPAPMGDWLGVRLVQSDPNHAAIGAWIEVRIGDRVLTREVTIGGGHAGGQLGWMHFGLGEADHAEIRVEWPDGEDGPWLRVAANQFAEIERGVAEPRIIEPPNH